MIAAGSGTDAAADYEAGYKIGQGVGALINNWLFVRGKGIIPPYYIYHM